MNKNKNKETNEFNEALLVIILIFPNSYYVYLNIIPVTFI